MSVVRQQTSSAVRHSTQRLLFNAADNVCCVTESWYEGSTSTTYQMHAPRGNLQNSCPHFEIGSGMYMYIPYVPQIKGGCYGPCVIRFLHPAYLPCGSCASATTGQCFARWCGWQRPKGHDDVGNVRCSIRAFPDCNVQRLWHERMATIALYMCNHRYKYMAVSPLYLSMQICRTGVLG